MLKKRELYSLLMLLGVWILYFTHQFLQGNRTLLMRGGLVLSTVAFLYGHGAGFLILISVSSYVTLYLFGNNINKWNRFLLKVFY